MKKRLIVQDNLWFLSKPELANYVLNGQKMVSLVPRLGFTSSRDRSAKRKELRWLNRYTGPGGSGLVIAQQWHRPGNLIDRTLRDSWLSIFEESAPLGKWCLFYDPILSTTQRGLVEVGETIDFSEPKILRHWKRDLEYLQQYFDHPQYWRLNNGHPVLYVWSAWALKGLEKAFPLARNHGLYLLAETLGTDVVPPSANALTGFTAALPGLDRRRYRLPELMPLYRESFERAAATGLDLIPAGSCQYDDSAYIAARGLNEKPLQILASNPREIEDYLRLALSFSRPIDGTRYLFWGTLNNWAEGTTLLPTKRRGPQFPVRAVGHYGFEHLKAVRKVLFGS